MYIISLFIGILLILLLCSMILFQKSPETFDTTCVVLEQCNCNEGCPDGVQCIPKSDATIKIPTVDKDTIDSCHVYDPTDVVPWTNIAQDWITGGGAKEDCAAALIIASGETSCTKDGCNAVQNGLWQVTSADTPPLSGCEDGNFNNCCNVDLVRNHFHTDKGYQVSCFGNYSKNSSGVPDIAVPDIVPSDHSGRGLGGTQYNWIGPFCHTGAFTCDPDDEYCHSSIQTGIDGDNWGGGSQWKGEITSNKQIFPFPYYYYAKFLESAADDPECDTLGECHCAQPLTGEKPDADLQTCLNEKIVKPAIQKAQEICSAYT